MDKKEKIRENVSDAYAKAVTDTGGCGCGCGPSCGPEQKGVAAKLAGYTVEELKALPPEAVVNSFGCGNPLAFGEVNEGDVVLDLGSGGGIDILLAAKKVGPNGRAIGVDMTDEMIEKANENIAASGLRNVEVRKGLIEDLPVESGSVDWVISNCVINLSPEKEKVFAEIFRTLKPGGRVLISDMVVEDMPSWVRESKSLYSSCIAGAVSEKEYLRGMGEAGLHNIAVRDRLVYDLSQLEDFVSSEVATEEREAEGTVDLVRRAARELKGKVASIQVFARKPAE